MTFGSDEYNDKNGANKINFYNCKQKHKIVFVIRKDILRADTIEHKNGLFCTL